jgi:2-keto-4-pentenoate hydratase/2-oxohepta-3-ene-1,7-dioic acid hydratase in catechol pathway
MDCVFGYTIGNDVSERSWQKADRGLWRAKNADTFKPMGPWIETSVDLDQMETDVVEIEITGIGTLRNKFVAET